MALTPEQRDEIRAREQDVSPGPWTVAERIDRLNGGTTLPILSGEMGHIAVIEYDSGGFQWPHAQARADAEFIAHARQDVPDLLAEVDRLTAELSDQDDDLAKTRTAYREIRTERTALRAELALTRQRNEAALAEHPPYVLESGEFCQTCVDRWHDPNVNDNPNAPYPCPTVRALTGQDGDGNDR